MQSEIDNISYIGLYISLFVIPAGLGLQGSFLYIFGSVFVW